MDPLDRPTANTHDYPTRTENAWIQGTLFDVSLDGTIRYHEEESLAHEVGRKAADLVSGSRNEDYGHPLDDFAKQAKMWSVIFGVDVTEEQVALAMICVKIARELNRPKVDNVLDGVGYWMTLSMIRQERERRSA